MNITEAYASIRNRAGLLGANVPQADDDLIEILREPLKVRISRNDANKLLRSILRDENPTREDVIRLLSLSKPQAGDDWYLDTLAAIDLWLDSRQHPAVVLASVSTTLPSDTDDSAALSAAASQTTLLAAGSQVPPTLPLDPTPPTPPPVPVIQQVTPSFDGGNPEHARRLLTHVQIPLPQRQSGMTQEAYDQACWNVWTSQLDNWEITELTFHRNLQPDFFTAAPHVKTVFTVRYIPTGATVPGGMGPDDARNVFIDRRPAIDQMVETSRDERRRYSRRANEIIRLQTLFPEQVPGYETLPVEQVPLAHRTRAQVVQTLTPFNNIENIGNNEFNVIDTLHTRMETLWTAQCSPQYTAHNFLQAVDNINRLITDLNSNRRRNALTQQAPGLAQFQPRINTINQSGIIPSFLGGALPTNQQHIADLVGTYQDLLQYQRDLAQTFAVAATTSPVEPLDRVYALPNGQAALLALRYLLPGAPQDLTIFDLNGNGVAYTVADRFGAQGETNPVAQVYIYDVVTTSPASYAGNPNPDKMLLNLSQVSQPNGSANLVRATNNQLFTCTPDVVFLNFTLNHMRSPNRIKETIIAARQFLGQPREGRPAPRIVILLPERFRLEQSPLNNVLQGLGCVHRMQINGSNELTQAARVRIRGTEGGSDITSGVNSRVGKSYVMDVYEVVDPADVETVRLMPDSSFSLVADAANGRDGNGNGEGNEGELSPRGILSNLSTGRLFGGDINTPPTAVVQISDILNDPIRSAAFDNNLSVLMRFRDNLPQDDQRTLDTIVTLLDRQFVTSLSQRHVDFIMQTPSQIRIDFGDFPEHLRQHLQQQLQFPPQIQQGANTLTIDELRILEDHYRQTNQTQSLVQELRPPLVQRLAAELNRRWMLHRNELALALNGAQTMADLQTRARGIFAAFKTFCLGGDIVVIPRTNQQQVQLYASQETIQSEDGTRVLLSPSYIVRPCDLTGLIPPNASLGERISIHQTNTGLRDVGVDERIRNAGLNVPPGFIQQAKGLPSLSRNALTVIAEALSQPFSGGYVVTPEDLLPPSSNNH